MALGRGSKSASTTSESVVKEGLMGRLEAPPPGGIYVRDPIAARAKAIREQAELFSSQGLPVPDGLRDLVKGLRTPANKSDVDLLDADGLHELKVDEGEPPAAGTAGAPRFPEEEKAAVAEEKAAAEEKAEFPTATDASETHGSAPRKAGGRKAVASSD